MEKDKIFFDTKGLTVTSANHIANMAKEAYKASESMLNNAQFYTTEVGLLGTSCKNVIKEGITADFLANIKPTLKSIAEFKSLIAWLREAIKAKERLIRESEKLSDEEIAEVLNISIPNVPLKYPRLTEDDVVSTWGIKQRNRYYYIDTICSTIGTYIHPERGFSNARESLIRAVSEPNTINGTGRDMVIYTKTPTVTVTAVNDTFASLQEEYREYQAELNSMKHQIEVALQEDDREKSQKELLELKNYQEEIKVINLQISTYRKDKVREMQSLKIRIPDSLMTVYNLVSRMGK